MIEKFTAGMARATMPDESKFEELVADCHMRIVAAAKIFPEISQNLGFAQNKF